LWQTFYTLKIKMNVGKQKLDLKPNKLRDYAKIYELQCKLRLLKSRKSV
jgi:hypothetical protein